MKPISGLLAVVGLSFVGIALAQPVEAAAPENIQVAQAGLPADVAAQIIAAINSGNSQTLANTIAQLIAANPTLADSIVQFAVAQDPNDAPTIAVAAATAVQAQGGDPAAITLVVIAAVKSQIQPAGGLTEAQVTTLVDEVITQVEASLDINVNPNGNANLLVQFSPPPVVLPPPASPH